MPMQPLIYAELSPSKITTYAARSCGLLLIALATAPAYSAEKSASAATYQIRAQTLDKALVDFSLKSGVQVVADGKLTSGVKSADVSGRYSPEQALQKMLAGTGLTVQSSENGTVTLQKASTLSPQSSAATTLPTVTVTDTADFGGADSGSKNYAVYSSKSATRTDTPLMQTPQSIQVINRSVIDDQQNITVSESLRNVSGVIPTNPMFTPAVDATRIRGFASEQLLDGFTQYYAPGDRESTINVQRIEVLKGSNGILYSGGSGSPVGGVVNIVSKLPTAKAFGEVGFKIGTNDFYQPFVDINQPLISNNVLFRFTGEYTNSSSFIDTVNTKRFNINPTLTFTNNDTTTFTLQGKVSRWEQPEYQGLPATGTMVGNFSTHRKAFLGPSDIPDSTSESNAVWGTLDHKFNDVWSINLKARYSNSLFDEKVQSLVGADGFVADVPFFAPSTWLLSNAELRQKQEERSFLGNISAKFDVGRTKNTLLFGADHSDFSDKGYIDADFGPFGFGVGSVDITDPKFTVAYTKPGLGENNQFVDNVTYGGYTQLQSTIYDRFHLLTSVRIAHVGIDYESLGTSYVADKTKVLPRVGGVFDLTDEFSLFFNYSEGMRGQPFVTFIDKPAPEESVTIEGGLKFDFAHQLTGQVAGYQIDRSHVAVSNGFLASTAAGKQRSVGFETDLVWQATDALSILANYSHTDAQFSDDKTTGVAQGNQLAMVPQNTGRLWANYRFQQPWLKGFSVGGGLYAQSEAYLSNNNTFKSDGYHTFDASLSYEQKHFKLAATIKNLTDEEYYQAYGYFGGRVIPSQGTSAYFTASVKY